MTSVRPTQTVMRYLREVEYRRGTKEGCAEGDCGACTVVIGKLCRGRLRYQAVNACIQFVGTLDGCQLLTVEDVKTANGRLHPIQTAMVEHHASQCGFCTPGFIMSLYAIWLNGWQLDRQGIEDALAGNLCRCTGYGPIIDAAKQIETMPAHIADPALLAKLRSWQDDASIEVGEGGKSFFAPASIDVCAELASSHTQGTIVAGATDVGLWVTKQNRKPDPIISLARVSELNEIEEGEELRIGATVSYQDAMPLIARHYPGALEMFRRLGSLQIRGAGTIGGNIANGSPIGDSPPMLIAAGARILLRHGDAERALPLEDFYIAYGKQDRQAGEILTKIVIPLPAPASIFRVYKISKRFDQDISSVCAAFNIRVENGKVTRARIAMGGMAAIPKRALHMEDALTGKIWDETSVRRAMAAVTADFAPISDLRASAGYRAQIAQNLLLKCYLERDAPRPITGPARIEHA